jgi:hypothetical protein
MKYLNMLIIALLISLSAAASVSAEPLTVDVIPVDNDVFAGETATYKVNLTNGGTTTETLTDLYVLDGPADFTIVFSETSGAVLPGQTKVVDLSVTVPAGKPEGQYTFDVYADWQKQFGKLTIKKTSNYLGVVLNVLIPEFPTIALPIISVLGIMLLMTRRKGKE